MSRIHEIQKHISDLYKKAREPSVKVPLSVQALESLTFAKDYAAAATLVAEQSHLWLPRLQLTGQAVESALRACLAGSGARPAGDSHDLVKLYSLIAARGYSLSEPEQAAIVHLSHFYHQDLGTSTRFKARYPARTAERLGGAVPNDAAYAQIVRTLCEQAQRAIDRLHTEIERNGGDA